MSKKNIMRLALIVVFIISLSLLISCDSTYTVTFDTDGGSEIPKQEVSAGGLATQPPQDPVKDGYSFDGWYHNNDTWKFKHYTVNSDITLIAKWVPNYTVKFETDGGTEIEDQIVRQDTFAKKPANPKREGFEFIGWYVGDAEWKFETEAVKKDVTIKAKWLALHTVSFDTDGGNVIPNQIVKDGLTAEEPDAPTKSGFVFAGWYLDDELWNFDTPIISATAFKAKWTAEFKVDFDSDGGELVTVQYIQSGEFAEEPATPTKAGYMFVFWYDANDTDKTPWNFEENAITQAITLKAEWKKYHTIKFENLKGGTIDDIEVLDGETLTAPTSPSHELYIFEGWLNGSNGTWDFSSPVTSDMTLSAKWRDNYCTVIFDTNGGSAAPESLKIPLGETVPKPTQPTKDGVAFVCWQYFAGAQKVVWNFDTKLDSVTTITLIAAWTNEFYTVTFELNGATGNIPKQYIAKNSGLLVEKPDDPIRAGYRFGGWISEIDDTLWSFETASPVSDVTLKAFWIKIHTVTFDYNGGSITGDSSKLADDGTKINEPDAPEKAAHRFIGWYNGETIWNFASMTVTEDITLTAKWEEVFTLKFDLNGGNLNKAPTVKDQYFAKTNPAQNIAQNPGVPEKTGYRFIGWYKGETAWNFATMTISENTTLVAKWERIYIVNFEFDGGQADIDPITVTVNGTITKPTQIPQKKHYVFAGWYDKDDPTKTIVTDFSAKPITKNTTFVAKWDLSVYTITFDANDGTPVPDVQHVEYGSLITKPQEDPELNQNYIFLAWYDENGKIWDFTKTPERDMTLKAYWLQVSSGNDGIGGLGPSAGNVIGPSDDW